MASFLGETIFILAFALAAKATVIGHDGFAYSSNALLRSEGDGPSQKHLASKHDHLTVCKLPLCTSGAEHDAPRLFVVVHSDGFGHVFRNILDGIAVAKAANMSFGGTVLQSQADGYNVLLEDDAFVDGHIDIGEHRRMVAFRTALKKLFGHRYGRQMRCAGRFRYDRKFEKVSLLLQDRANFQPLANIFLPEASATMTVSNMYTESVRASLRSYLASQPTVFKPAHFSVAIHVRRGDLSSGDAHISPNEYYFRHIDALRRVLAPTGKKLDIHVWSSLSNPGFTPSEYYWKTEDFDGFRARGAKVHLDEDDDFASIWTNFARARVFIMSKSSYSYVGAVLNTQCVIRPEWFDDHLDNWVDGKAEGPAYDAAIAQCVKLAGL
eukprot:TRINITY_DN15101_c0_g1_i1.p1 TRINITY_DN15101_c0_g1~~TRINITY_DN15101_c0_g1_i1.p1  ORF type:complete len:390 (+),score=62.93 TRINITY_DN15101_c0_g1_i1:29-1171(+)